MSCAHAIFMVSRVAVCEFHLPFFYSNRAARWHAAARALSILIIIQLAGSLLWPHPKTFSCSVSTSSQDFLAEAHTHGAIVFTFYACTISCQAAFLQ